MTDSAEHSVTPRYGQAIVQTAERLGLALPAHLTERDVAPRGFPLLVRLP